MTAKETSMRAPDKTRYLNALRHVESEEIPFFEMEIETTVAARILGRPLPPVRPFEIPAGDYVELNLRVGNDMVHYRGDSRGELVRVARRRSCSQVPFCKYQ